ncbi:adenosylmethionine--8-amino-7-oxononanoate transaminase [Parasediminibacterium sp. JCM 36343]|uniref:adenosylmethionine--8-amino-7-oxononanoate transaminase n=1 Tax=Parasediminibacterium sp. JCM 36343 TaxID=3374279 RepID=UPI00397E7AC2
MTLQERDHAVIWHPFTQQKNRQPPVPIVKGKGTLLFDEQGNEYIDAISSWWVTLHGHAHPYIAEKLYQQALTLEQVIFAGFTHEPAVSLAERLLPIIPGNFARIFYSDNGSTSTEVALKMSLQYWWNNSRGQLTVDSEQITVNSQQSTFNGERTKILAFNDAYHGDTFGAMSVSDRSVFTLAFHDKLFEVIFIDTPNADNISQLKQIVISQGQEIAAFIYEPLVQGAGGIKMYEAKWMDELLKAVKQQGIICIADEVMTGFGRTGKLFASEYMTEKPDIICLSKGLTGGTMALGITACTDKIYQAYVNDDKLKTFFHGHSFTANPLACTAALASLDLLLKPECQQQIDWISTQNKVFANHLTTLNSNSTPDRLPTKSRPTYDLRHESLRTLGTILAFEIAEGQDGYLNNISTTITQKAMEQGIYIRPLGNTVYIMPPYCITLEELGKVYGMLEELLG